MSVDQTVQVVIGLILVQDGKATRLAAKRRAWVRREEDRLKEERRSYWHANLGERWIRGGQLRIT